MMASRWYKQAIENLRLSSPRAALDLAADTLETAADERDACSDVRTAPLRNAAGLCRAASGQADELHAAVRTLAAENERLRELALLAVEKSAAACQLGADLEAVGRRLGAIVRDDDDVPVLGTILEEVAIKNQPRRLVSHRFDGDQHWITLECWLPLRDKPRPAWQRAWRLQGETPWRFLCTLAGRPDDAPRTAVFHLARLRSQRALLPDVEAAIRLVRDGKGGRMDA